MNTGFKDSFALFQKLPDLLADFKHAFIVNEERLRFTLIPDSSKLIYRKVVTVLQPYKQTFILFVKSDDLESASHSVKVVLTEQRT